MKLEMFVIGFAAFGLIFLLGLGIYSEGLNTYNVDVDTSTSFGKISYNVKELYGYSIDTKDKLTGGAVSDTDAVNEMIAGGYKGIRTSPFRSLTIATNITQTLVTETPMSGIVSPFIIQFILLVLTVLVIFTIIYLIFRFQAR